MDHHEALVQMKSDDSNSSSRVQTSSRRDDDYGGFGNANLLPRISPHVLSTSGASSTAAVKATDPVRQQRQQKPLDIVDRSPGATIKPNHRFTPPANPTNQSSSTGGLPSASATSILVAPLANEYEISCDVPGAALEDESDLEKYGCRRQWQYAGGSKRNGSTGGRSFTFSWCTNTTLLRTRKEDVPKSHCPTTCRLLGVRCRKPVQEEEEGGMTCCRGVFAVLKFGFSTVTAAVTLLLMGMAALVTFWALFPVCTRCRHHHHYRAQERSVGATAGSESLKETGRSTLYINELQVIGTHNSYHRRTTVPAAERFWMYRYPSLTEQLDRGIRNLELDIHYDWKTGRWFVYHLSVLDAMTTCNCFSVCLEEIKQWSDMHPAHHILFVTIELKVYGDFLQICGDKTPETDNVAFLQMQKTVLDAFPRDRILTPRDVRGDYPSLGQAIRASLTTQQAPTRWAGGDGINATRASTENEETVGGVGGEVLAGGWPKVDESRGMVLFVIDYQSNNIKCRDGIREALPDDETMFFERVPIDEAEFSDRPAFTEVPNHIDQSMVMWMVVERGFIVRRRLGSSEWASSEHKDGDEVSTRAPINYLANTSAQLLVANDLKLLSKEGDVSDDAAGSSISLPCRSRCSTVVPNEACLLEGFC